MEEILEKLITFPAIGNAGTVAALTVLANAKSSAPQSSSKSTFVGTGVSHTALQQCKHQEPLGLSVSSVAVSSPCPASGQPCTEPTGFKNVGCRSSVEDITTSSRGAVKKMHANLLSDNENPASKQLRSHSGSTVSGRSSSLRSHDSKGVTGRDARKPFSIATTTLTLDSQQLTPFPAVLRASPAAVRTLRSSTSSRTTNSSTSGTNNNYKSGHRPVARSESMPIRTPGSTGSSCYGNNNSDSILARLAGDPLRSDILQSGVGGTADALLALQALVNPSAAANLQFNGSFGCSFGARLERSSPGMVAGPAETAPPAAAVVAKVPSAAQQHQQQPTPQELYQGSLMLMPTALPISRCSSSCTTRSSTSDSTSSNRSYSRCSSTGGTRSSSSSSASSEPGILHRTSSRSPALKTGTGEGKPKVALLNSRAQMPALSAVVSTDPAVWLPQQHPAVVAALKTDIQAAAAAAAMSQSVSENKLSKQKLGLSSTTAQLDDDVEVGQAELEPAQKPVNMVGINTEGSRAYDSKGSATACAWDKLSSLLSGTDIGCEKPRKRCVAKLKVPLFPGTSPTLVFSTGLEQQQQQLLNTSAQQQQVQQNIQGVHEQQQEQQQSQVHSEVLPLPSVKMLVKYYGVANNTVKQVFKSSGFKVTKGDNWSVLWGSLAPPEMLAGITTWQRHNHFPGTWELGRKDRLYRKVAAAARRTRCAAFHFVPKFFILPNDLEEFKLDLAQNPNATYIRKPVASSRGRGVRVVPDAKALDAAAMSDVILQLYIPNPLLIGGRKFDMRVYVAVTSLDPLWVYVYREGLVRFASEQYSSSKSSLKHATMHLTNYSVNKAAPNFKQPSSSQHKLFLQQQSSTGQNRNELQSNGLLRLQHVPQQQEQPQEMQQQQQQQQQGQRQHTQQQRQQQQQQEEVDAVDGAECSDSCASKWSFGQLQEHLQQQGHDWDKVWQQVCAIAVQTTIATEPSITALTRSTSPTLLKSCFEVFGFDILLDTDMRAWLLEVNTCPALNADSPLDMEVKSSMIADLLGLVGVTPCDRQAYQQAQATDRQTRLTGLGSIGALSRKGSIPAAAAGSSISKSPSRHTGSAAAVAASSVAAPNNTTRVDSNPSSSGGRSACRAPATASQDGRTANTTAGSSGKHLANAAQAAAAAAAAAARTIKDVEQLDLMAVPPEQLPEAIRETEAEWRRCCQQQQRWQRVFPDTCSAQLFEKYIGLFETARVSNALVMRYYYQQQQWRRRQQQ